MNEPNIICLFQKNGTYFIFFMAESYKIMLLGSYTAKRDTIAAPKMKYIIAELNASVHIKVFKILCHAAYKTST